MAVARNKHGVAWIGDAHHRHMVAEARAIGRKTAGLCPPCFGGEILGVSADMLAFTSIVDPFLQRCITDECILAEERAHIRCGSLARFMPRRAKRDRTLTLERLQCLDYRRSALI